MKCNNCGSKIKKNYKLCPNCGEKVVVKEKINNKKINVSIIIVISMLVVLVLSFVTYKLFFQKVDINDLKKSVVLIYVYDKNDELTASGSGAVAFDNNIVLTNAHVVEDNYKLEVISEDNTKYVVDGILAYDKKKDMAIIKLKDSKNLKALKINKKISVGDDVTAIGSPLGLKNTVSNGNLSGYFQDNVEVYQHTAPISHGSSGGALFDKKGNLVGITYASIEGGQNLNMAIPIKYFEEKYNKVKDNSVIKTKYYSYLSNSILSTKEGSKLINFVLNDKYGNNKFTSGIYDESKEEKGYLEKCLNLGSCIYVNDDDYNEIKDNVTASLFIQSGIQETLGTLNWVDGEGVIDKSTAEEMKGYSLVLLKKKEQNVDSKLKEFIKNNFEYDNSYIKSNDNYIYGFKCKNYNKCDEVEKIVSNLISE